MKNLFIKSISKIIAFFLSTIFLLSVYSCCKEGDCKCDLHCGEYWEHFIAHAGGAIDGINYTNCVEAMDLSYSKGCKLFELDLVFTTDGKMIAKHDPPEITEVEFMSELIEGKYTPMNMETINDWFRKHPDAILVTDKINDTQRIYDEFLFQDRVIMELFTWEAIDKAISLGIKPMVSENLIFGKSEKAMKMGISPLESKSFSNIEKILKDKKIEYTCMSRIYALHGNEKFLKRLKTNGIKNYFYHLEWGTNGKPAEQYVWDNEMDYCYGMYANDLDLLGALLNEKK